MALLSLSLFKLACFAFSSCVSADSLDISEICSPVALPCLYPIQTRPFPKTVSLRDLDDLRRVVNLAELDVYFIDYRFCIGAVVVDLMFRLSRFDW